MSNYVAALNHGLRHLRDGFPLSLRLIREIHEVLLSKGRGSHAQPGEYRRSQNWIGGTRPGNATYLPPPPEYVLDCMGQLESFLHLEESSARASGFRSRAIRDDTSLSRWKRESWHTAHHLMLCAKEVLREPVLYLSMFFKKHQRLYYDRLNGTREDEGWTAWMDFFLQGVRDTANQAARTASNIDKLFRTDKEKIEHFAAARRPGCSFIDMLKSIHCSPSRALLAR